MRVQEDTMKTRFRKHVVTAMLTGALLAASTLLVVADVDDQYSDWSAPVDLGPTVNSTSNEFAPVISKDGLSLYFASNRPGGFGALDIWVSQRPSMDLPWGTPQNLGPNINTPFAEGGLSLSMDGHRLYFHSNRPGGFGGQDLYVSRRHNKRDDFGWRPAENLGSGVNTMANENRPFQFEDDMTGAITLYFDSNRPGGPGRDDIYASILQPDETFGSAFLVLEVSTPADDQGPRLRRDGLEIFLASNRPGSIATLSPFATDIWVATRPSTADPWSMPIHLGAPINSEFTDSAGSLSFDGTALYISTCRNQAISGCDLWVATRTKLKAE
jgi:hypothetical protein